MSSRITQQYGLHPRGVLNLAADEKKFGYLRCLPAVDLGVFVEHFWMVRWDLRGADSYNAQTVSHPSVQIGLQKGMSRVYGVVKGRSSHTLKGIGELFGVKFRPGGFYPFLKSPLSRITNRTLQLGEVFGHDGEKLEQSVLSIPFGAMRAQAAESFLRERLPEPDRTAILAGQIVDEICLNRNIMNVDQVSARFGLTTRTLQRLFDQYVGVTPKWVIRIYRLHEIVEQLNSGRPAGFAALAQDLGYFDQAHFAKDFKSVVGYTPAGYLKQVRK